MSVGVLKPGWRRVKFGDVVKLNTDKVANPQEEGLERYVGLEHLEPGDLRVRRWGLVEEGTTFTNYFRPGQVLFGKRRAYQRKVAVADFDGVCSGDIYVFETKDPKVLLPELLPFICQTGAFFDYAVGTSAGSLSPRTNWTSLARYEFELPGLEEQESIAQLLQGAEDSLTTYKDLLISGRTLLKSFRQNLIPSGRARVYRVEEVANLVTKGESPRWQGFEYSDEGILFITSENVGNNQLLLEAPKYISDAFHSRLRRSKILPGDVLINIVGASIGRASIVPPSIVEANTNQAVAVVRFKENYVIPQFFLEWYLSSSTQQFIFSRQVNTARANISLTDIRNFEIPALSNKEQVRIINEINVVNQQVKCVEGRIDHTTQMKTKILNEGLTSKHV